MEFKGLPNGVYFILIDLGVGELLSVKFVCLINVKCKQLAKLQCVGYFPWEVPCLRGNSSPMQPVT